MELPIADTSWQYISTLESITRENISVKAGSFDTLHLKLRKEPGGPEDGGPISNDLWLVGNGMGERLIKSNFKLEGSVSLQSTLELTNCIIP
ncbi:MAG: hypothetical protein HQK54_15195 [Oligoflexales bacterium]|nr:hypothetical protein [Oligoflexales bacterium]